MKAFDHTTLSAYLDGELDRSTMREVEAYLDRDTDARRYVLDALHATVLLRASGRRVRDERVPPALTNIFTPRGRPAATPAWVWSLRRPALALAVLLLGIGMGLIMRPGTPTLSPSGFPTLPATYTKAVNESLENHLSGEPFVLETAVPGQRIVVTPIRTYRSRKGRYYRDYLLELYAAGERRQMRGQARRTGKKQWETTTIYYNPQTNTL